MRYFLAYHNAEKMGYSCTAITTPSVKTSKSVAGLEGSTVWLIAGEGKSLKNYFLASTFVVDKCEPDKYPRTKLANELSGAGTLLGTSVSLNMTPLLRELQRLSANFVNGFCELRDTTVISALKALAR